MTLIQIKGVSKTYGNKKNRFVALDNITFNIPSGKSVAIIGKSGSGKSTLMHIMSGLDRPENGEVIIGNKNILTLSQKESDKFRSHAMSFIFQSFFVQGNESCYNNVSLPLEIAGVPRPGRKKLIEDALKSVELEDKIKSRARDLSGGQKQRLAIARAIVNRPKILFADEPTGNLDSVTGDLIEQLLFNYCKKTRSTLIVVTHDMDIAEKCDIQVRLVDGKIDSIKGAKK